MFRSGWSGKGEDERFVARADFVFIYSFSFYFRQGERVRKGALVCLMRGPQPGHRLHHDSQITEIASSQQQGLSPRGRK